MSGGQFTIPLIIRAVTGGGAGLAATHSQCLEGWFASVPGLTVAVPATPYDALGLLRAAFEDKNPIIFAEHALLYATRGEVPDDYYTVPFGQATVQREGDGVTLVAYSQMVHVALQAAKELARRGVEAEVVDLRTLRPLDMATVVQSVRKTKRAVVVEEAWRTGGFGAEIAARIQEEAFDDLDGPVARVGGEEAPMPYARRLEQLAIPDAQRVVRAVEETFGI